MCSVWNKLDNLPNLCSKKYFMKNYIIGYGSLISRVSRLRTIPSAQIAYPIKVKGYTRGWWARTGVYGYSTTFLGCVSTSDFRKFEGEKENDDYFNGVVFEVSDEELVSADKREKGYLREKVPFGSIEFYGEMPELDTDGNFFVYLNQFETPDQFFLAFPSVDMPVVQSYVDICLEGCIEIEQEYSAYPIQEYTSDFLATCQSWNTSWVNDRIQPRRPHTHFPLAQEVDRILYQSQLYEIYKNVKIE